MKSKALVRFAEKNAKELKKLPRHNQVVDMVSQLTCVLRPLALPKYILNDMTKKEFKQYQKASLNFVEPEQIDKAVEWVKTWVKT